MAHPGGRPIEYSEKSVSEAKLYLDSCVQTYVDGKLTKANIPTLSGLALWLEINRDTIYDWSDKYPEFSDIADKCMMHQEISLIQNGLTGTFNSTIVKLLLSKHGYRDSIDTDVTSKGQSINTLDPKVIALSNKYEDELKKQL